MTMTTILEVRDVTMRFGGLVAFFLRMTGETHQADEHEQANRLDERQ